ncbi:MAG: RlmE family RNA methyltransferase [Gammaproteobacteria bacterium]|nr:RlmE family RNA methyltransferase [Gammaproteobacteria bacterium]
MSERGRQKNSQRKTKQKRRGSSERWLQRQRKDPFARKAADEGLGSRAHFKLQQLDERLGLLRPGMRVLELGAAPGGWTAYLESRLKGGQLIVCDSRPIQTNLETVVIEGLFGEAETDARIAELLTGRDLDLVLSDMAPNITGVRATDQARVMDLADLALEAAESWLKPGGSLVVKLFQGEGVDDWMGDLRKGKQFAKIRLVKPKASRPDSREVYAVGQQFLVTG